MHPQLLDSVSVYFLMWLVAAATGLGAGTWLAVRSGYPAVRSALALAILAGAILVGSKLLYVAEAAFFPTDDYVPLRLRSTMHGFRIPGGMVALALLTPLVCRALGLPWRAFGDRLIPLAALALVFIRLGCFLNGCCLGRVSEVPWAVSFPRGGWAHWYHATRGWVPADAPASLAVHPLQLYFLLAAVLSFALLVRLQSCTLAPGRLQAVFYLLFFGATAVIEPFRENHLTLNRWLAPAATVLAAALLLAGLAAFARDRLVQPHPQPQDGR